MTKEEFREFIKKVYCIYRDEALGIAGFSEHYGCNVSCTLEILGQGQIWNEEDDNKLEAS